MTLSHSDGSKLPFSKAFLNLKDEYSISSLSKINSNLFFKILILDSFPEFIIKSILDKTELLSNCICNELEDFLLCSKLINKFSNVLHPSLSQVKWTLPY